MLTSPTDSPRHVPTRRGRSGRIRAAHNYSGSTVSYRDDIFDVEGDRQRVSFICIFFPRERTTDVISIISTDQYRLCTILQKHAVATYKLVYQYQMKIVRHYALNKLRRKLDDFTKSDWGDLSAKAEKECTQVEKIIQTWAFADDRARYNSLAGDLANIASDIKSLQDEIRTGFNKAEVSSVPSLHLLAQDICMLTNIGRPQPRGLEQPGQS